MFTEIRPSKILITGANGQLGSDLVETLSQEHNIIPVDKENFDISEFKAANNCITNIKPEVIIHPAAYTDVDGCEKDKDKAFKVNAIGTKNLSIVARKIGAKFFYISTDYVFDGNEKKPYSEYDSPNPISVYGKSKFLGENFVKEQTNRFFIIRIGWLYGKKGKNFLKKMIELAGKENEIKVVCDQIGSPTWTVNIARQLNKLIPTELYGTYHCTSQGSCSWFEFALEIFKGIGYEVKNKEENFTILDLKTRKIKLETKKTIKLQAIKSEDFKTAATRPKNSVLENYMLKLQNIDIMPHWEEALTSFLNMASQSLIPENLEGK